MDLQINIPEKSPCMMEKQWLIKSKTGDISEDYDFNPKKDIIGEGSYGIVYKAIQKLTGQSRAIKCITKTRIKNQQRLKNEIQVMATLDHPNILRMFETYENEKYVYLVLELCQGGELFDRITERGFYKEQKALQIFKQIMSAINYCHFRKVCHRDLKPENFLFSTQDDDSIIKVIDFGLSKTYGTFQLDSPLKKNSNNSPLQSNEKNIMKTRAGTPYYIAPEVLDGNYDEKCDIWSAGVTLYIMLCGYPPFFGKTDKEILYQVKKMQFEYEGEEWDEVSEECKILIKRMISKPELRLNSEMVLSNNLFKNQENNNAQQKIPLENFVQWNTFSKLKTLVIHYIVSQLSIQQTESVGKLFMQLDKDMDGFLTFHELLEGVEYQNQEQQEIIYQAFQQLVNLIPNKIAFTDFACIAINSTIYCNESYVSLAFKFFDKYNQGKITVQNLQELFTDNEYYQVKNVDYWEDMVNFCDIKKNGYIDFEEFQLMMKNQL